MCMLAAGTGPAQLPAAARRADRGPWRGVHHPRVAAAAAPAGAAAPCPAAAGAPPAVWRTDAAAGRALATAAALWKRPRPSGPNTAAPAAAARLAVAARSQLPAAAGSAVAAGTALAAAAAAGTSRPCPRCSARAPGAGAVAAAAVFTAPAPGVSRASTFPCQTKVDTNCACGAHNYSRFMPSCRC
jgi:hypothetical protein